MTDITIIRNNINDIDEQILQLLAKRKQQCLAVADFKYRNALPIKDSNRENEHLLELINKGQTLGLSSQLIDNIYDEIFSDSVALQMAHLQTLINTNGNYKRKIKVAFLGIAGTYSYLATYKFFHDISDHIIERNCNSFQEILCAVENNEVDCALMPIENTSSGCINEVYDLLQDTTAKIIGELTYPIEHCILAAKDTDQSKIKKVFAHPQPLSQCSNWLHDNLPNAELIPCSSSSEAMQKIQELANEESVAIGCEKSGKLYNEFAIYRNIANQKNNITRFIVISTNAVSVPSNVEAKTSITFTTENKPGALVKVLKLFSENNINMVKLQSRPRSPHAKNNCIWAETFYMDIIANADSALMHKVIRELKTVTGEIKILGCYPVEFSK
jgi:chorismate mutase / prephenate dehydratase